MSDNKEQQEFEATLSCISNKGKSVATFMGRITFDNSGMAKVITTNDDQLMRLRNLGWLMNDPKPMPKKPITVKSPGKIKAVKFEEVEEGDEDELEATSEPKAVSEPPKEEKAPKKASSAPPEPSPEPEAETDEDGEDEEEAEEEEEKPAPPVKSRKKTKEEAPKKSTKKNK